MVLDFGGLVAPASGAASQQWQIVAVSRP